MTVTRAEGDGLVLAARRTELEKLHGTYEVVETMAEAHGVDEPGKAAGVGGGGRGGQTWPATRNRPGAHRARLGARPVARHRRGGRLRTTWSSALSPGKRP
ncbi:MAG: hypothetical protein R2838_21160 [Caldilineaceae bacterium]